MAGQLVARRALGLRRAEQWAERFPWLEWMVEYSLVTAFSFVATVVGSHLGGQFEDRAERGWQSR